MDPQTGPVRAKVELIDNQWRVQIVFDGVVVRQRWFRRGVKAQAMTWAVQHVFLAAKNEVQHEC